MITIDNLFEIIAQAVKQDNNGTIKRWFIDYSGHVQKIDIRFFPHGWDKETNLCERLSQSTKPGPDIAAAYYFIGSRLKK